MPSTLPRCRCSPVLSAACHASRAHRMMGASAASEVGSSPAGASWSVRLFAPLPPDIARPASRRSRCNW
eukprot:3141460-Pyramimonas_sp.AAC.1